MSKRLKVIVSIVIILMLVASNCIFNSSDCNAAAAGERIDEDSKTVTLYVVPYDNVNADEAIPCSTAINISGEFKYNFYSELSEKSSGKKLYIKDKTVAGVTYHFKATLKSYENREIIKDFKFNVFNSVDRNDSSIFSNIKVYSPSDYQVNFECDVVFKAKPVLNLGTCNLHFAKEGGSLKSSDSRFEDIGWFLSYQVNRGLVKIYEFDENMLDYDLDKDGTYDIRYSRNGESAELYPLETSSIKGAYSLNELEERIQNLEYNYELYYEKYVFDFSPYTPPTNDDNNSGNNSNTANNTNNNTNNNSNNTNNNSNNTNKNTSNNTNNNNSNKNNNNSSDSTGNNADNNSSKSTYENEWVNGQWYGTNGDISYTAQGSWKSDSKGWWFEDTSGWYPQSQWQKIDGKWYYFTANGYMDYSEYRDGYWLGSDGALVDGYYGEWKSDSTGWWFEDQSGWYPISQWGWINGNCYYFKSNGYMATSEYIDGCWVNASGVWE